MESWNRGPKSRARRLLLEVVWRGHYPNVLLAQPVSGGVKFAVSTPILAERQAVSAEPTAYICRQYSCRKPAKDPPKEILGQLEEHWSPALCLGVRLSAC